MNASPGGVLTDAVSKLFGFNAPASVEQVRGVISGAILAERERCAKVAEQSAAWGSVTAKRIAADIRRGI